MTEVLHHTLESLAVPAVRIDKGLSRKITQIGASSPQKVWRALTYLMSALKALRSRPAVAIQFPALTGFPLALDVLVARLARISGVPLVLYLHGAIPPVSAVTGSPRSALLFRLLRLSTTSVALSARLASDVRTYDPAKPLFIIPNTIPDRLPAVRPTTTQLRVLCLSTIGESKGTAVMVDAAIRAVSLSPRLRASIVGQAHDGRFLQMLVDRVNTAGLAEQILFHGALYGEEKDALFDSSDIFVLPSYQEAFPLVILEAMRSSLAIIASRVGGIPDMIVEGESGLLIDPGNAEGLADQLRQLDADRDKRLQLGRQARARFESLYREDAFRSAWRSLLSNWYPHLAIPDGGGPARLRSPRAPR